MDSTVPEIVADSDDVASSTGTVGVPLDPWCDPDHPRVVQFQVPFDSLIRRTR